MAVPNYRRYWSGHAVSVIGTWVQRIGQDWLVLELTGSALALGGAMLCQFLPVLLGGVWGGLIVDRTDTRRLLMVTQVAQGLLAAGLAWFALSGNASLSIVYVLAAALGIVTVVDNPARHTFVAELVDESDIVNAQALNSLINNVGRLVGPALAGLLIASMGVGITFVVNAVTFVAVLVGLGRIDAGELRAPPIAPRARGQVREGLRYVWSHPELRGTVVLAAVVSVFGQNFRVVFPVLATESLGGGSATYGWLTAALGLGAVVGALVSAAASTATAGRLLWSCLAFGLCNLLVSVAPGLTAALSLVAVLGVLNMLFNTMVRAILQVSSAPGMRGRVMAVHVVVFLGGIPVGGPLLGVVVEMWGARAGMAVAGFASLAGCALVWRGLRRLPDGPIVGGGSPAASL
jgi:predicted MFS family arabinose efflux permease